MSFPIPQFSGSHWIGLICFFCSVYQFQVLHRAGISLLEFSSASASKDINNKENEEKILVRKFKQDHKVLFSNPKNYFYLILLVRGGVATIFFFVDSQWETGDSINKGWYSTQILIVINIRGITIENIYFSNRFTHWQFKKF